MNALLNSALSSATENIHYAELGIRAIFTADFSCADRSSVGAFFFQNFRRAFQDWGRI
jgi:hypothetical protein